MNKKATEYGLAFLAILFLLVLISASYQLQSKIKQYEPIGKAQYDLIKAYDNGEKALFYIDNAAKISAFEAINRLSQEGGLYSEDCSYYFGKRLLLNNNKTCVTEDFDIVSNYEKLFGVELSKHIQKYYLPLYITYDYNIDSQNLIKITAMSKDKQSIPIRIEDTSKQREYVVPAGDENVIRKIDETYGAKIEYEISSNNYDISKEFVIGVIMRETNGDPNIISSSGCAGLMQFCYSTAEDYKNIFYKLTPCVSRDNPQCNYLNDDRFNPDKSIKAGTYYLNGLVSDFGKYRDRESFALAAYNGGPSIVKAAIGKTGKSNPLWEEIKPHITEELVLELYCDNNPACPKSPYFAPKEKREGKPGEITGYVDSIRGFIAKYKEIMRKKADDEQTVIEERTGEEQKQCCVCTPQCGNFCSIDIIPKSESCGFTSIGKGVSCEMSYCVADEELIGLGDYYINPSFEIEIDYDLKVFEETYDVLEKIREAYEQSDDKNNFSKNIIEEAKKIDGEISWLETCEEDQERAFYSFAEQYYLCAKSTDAECYCEINIPKNIIESTFKIETNGLNTNFILEDKQELIQNKALGIKRRNSEETIQLQDIFISSDEQNYNIKLINLGQEFSYSINQPFYMYKSKQRISFIQKEQHQTEYQSYKSNICKVNIDTVKLCFETKNEIPVYSTKTQEMEYKNNVVDFAYHFKDSTAPQTIQNLVAKTNFPALNYEAIITWKHNDQDKDVAKFNVYYSLNNFENLTLNELREDPEIQLIELKESSDSIQETIDTDNPKSVLITRLGKIVFGTGFDVNTESSLPAQIIPEKNKLYFYRTYEQNNRDIKQYIAKIGFDSQVNHNVLITSVDNAGNEQRQDAPYFPLTPKDTLAPATWPLDGFDFSVEKKETENKIEVSWNSKPKKNVDGTDFNENELLRYEVYIAEDMQKEDLFSKFPRLINKELEFTEFDITDFSKNWCFYVVPVDNSNNKQFNSDTFDLMDDQDFFNPAPKCINS